MTVKLVAVDSSGHTVTSYDGTADLVSSDTKATLPSSVTFINGVATFQVTFETAGSQSVTATDSAMSSLTGSATTTVVAAVTPVTPTTPSPTTPTPTTPGATGIVTTTSSNWSGYAVATNLNSPQSNSVTAVSGSWTVPTVTGTGTAYSAVWVGIDGDTSSSVEQIGTEEDIVNGRAEYSVWYEMYPLGSVAISSMSVSPGDNITASVQYLTSGTNAGKFQLTITDTSQTNDTFTTYQSASGAQRSSAEWIVEAPSSNQGILSLANFGSVTFSNATATINGVTGPIDSTSWQASAINMSAGRGSLETSVSGLTDTNGASAFTDTYQAGASTTTTPGGYPGGSWRATKVLTAVSTNKSPNSSAATNNPLAVRDQLFASFDFI